MDMNLKPTISISWMSFAWVYMFKDPHKKTTIEIYGYVSD